MSRTKKIDPTFVCLSLSLGKVKYDERHMLLAPVLTPASMENLQRSLRTDETESSTQNPEGNCLPHPLLAGFSNFSPTFSQAPQKMIKGQEQDRPHTPLPAS